MSSFSWEELPDITEVRSALFNQADIKAQLKIAKLDLEIYQAELTKEKPRDSSVKLIGIDDTSRGRLQDLMNRVRHLESDLDRADAEVKFHAYRLEAAKMIGYKTRI